MKKLVIDLNSICTSSLLVGSDPEGYKEDGQTINTWEYGFDNFLKTYRKTLDELDLKPMHTIGVFDAPKSRERRQRFYKKYKAHRKPRPQEYYDEFNKLMDKVKQFIRHLGGIIVSAPKTEADDVIAHIAPKLDSVIWSKDKDLLSIGVPMWMDGELYLGDTCGDRFHDIPRKYVRLYRTLVGDTGDFGPGTSASGFGEKTFLALWVKYGEEGLDALIDLIENKQLERLVEDVDDFKPLQKIMDSADMVYTTWKLAGWLAVKDHKLKWQPGYAHESDCESYDDDFFEFYQSITLVTQKNLDSLMPLIYNHIAQSDYIALDLETAVDGFSEDWLNRIKENISRAPIQVDVSESKIVGVGITAGENLQHTYYFSIGHTGTDNIPTDTVKDLIMSIDKPKVCHNAGGFEIPVMYINWGVWVPDIYCSQIAASYVNENMLHGLKALSSRYYHAKQQSYMDVTDGRRMSELTAQEVLSYGADDTIMGGHLFNFFETILDVEGTFDIYAEVEHLPMYMVAHAFVHGINCDLDFIQSLHDADEKEANEALETIHNYLIEIGWKGTEFVPLDEINPAEIKRGFYMLHGKELKTRFRKVDKLAKLVEDETYGGLIIADDLDGINAYIKDKFVPRPEFKPGSTKDKVELLYTTLSFPVRFRNQVTDYQKQAGLTEGNPVVDEDALKWIVKNDANEDQQELINALLRWTNYSTRNGLYYHPYKFLAHWKDGKLRPNLKQSATTSRRFAPAGPNVNQLPKRSEEGRKVRGAIVPHHPDAVIVSPDFTGQELRLGAEATQDENFLACYIGDNLKDLHTLTAFEISKRQLGEFKEYEELARALDDPKHRLHKVAKAYRGVKAKPTNFLSQYVTKGGGAWTLSKKLQITEKEAEAFLEAKSEAFPGVDDWKEEYGMEVRKQGYAETFLGARKHTAELIARAGGGSIDHILRSAINFRIQSSGAEMTKLVLASIWEAELLENYDCRFYMPVHDELCFSVMINDLVGFTQALHPLMTQPYADMTVPIESSLSVGENFANLEEIDWAPESVSEWIRKYKGPEDIPF